MDSFETESGRVDEALARAVIYRALALGLRGTGAPVDGPPPAPAARAALPAAARVLDERWREPPTLLPAVSRLVELTSGPEDGLASACAPLFGHAQGEVSPYETDYGAAGAYQQPHEMADIAGFYMAFGVAPKSRVDERADHLACECEFMELLARKEAFLLAGGGPDLSDEERRETLDAVRVATRRFLREHLGRFGRAIATRLTRQPAVLQAALGGLLLSFLGQECRRFGVPPGPATLELRPPAPDDAPLACGAATCGLSAGDGPPERLEYVPRRQ